MNRRKKTRTKRPSQESWFSIFYPGLSEESIFEIYYDHANNQRNSLFGWFQKDGTYLLPQRIIDEFEYDNAVTDLRAQNKTYYKQDSWLGVWKYVGASTDGTTKRSGDQTIAELDCLPVSRSAVDAGRGLCHAGRGYGRKQ